MPVAHLFTTIAKLLGPGGARAVVADTFLWTARSRAQKNPPTAVSFRSLAKPRSRAGSDLRALAEVDGKAD